MDYTGGVDVFQSSLLSRQKVYTRAFRTYVSSTYQDLVQEVLDELFLKGSRREKSMKIGTQKFRYKITVSCQS